jgi:hypothetical protein
MNMRIGFVVDGQAEFRALPLLLAKVVCPNTLLGTIYMDLQPHAPLGQIARRVVTRLPVLESKGVTKVVVLIDRENNQCPGQWANEIQQAIEGMYRRSQIQQFAVVGKVRCFENWLVSDASAFGCIPRRFQPDSSRLQEICNNRADSVDAQALLRRWAIDKSYNKVDDAVRILAHADPAKMAKGSRSFRRFLRILENESYLHQSKQPTI